MNGTDLLPASVLKRKAVVYVRQSTPAQVQFNLESQRQQYELVEVARRRGFDADPSRTGRELLERLQAEHPERYPDRLLRTLQRRLKVWRGEMAQTLVFGIAGPPEPGPMPSMVTVPA